MDLGYAREYKVFTECMNQSRKDGPMGKVLTKSQVIGVLAEKHDLSKKVMKEIMENLSTLAYKEAKNGFTFPGIGKLVVQHRKARMGRNPQTGTAIKIPAKKVLKFRVTKAAKDAILAKK